jgi:hypothetical protein
VFSELPRQVKLAKQLEVQRRWSEARRKMFNSTIKKDGRLFKRHSKIDIGEKQSQYLNHFAKPVTLVKLKFMEPVE